MNLNFFYLLKDCFKRRVKNHVIYLVGLIFLLAPDLVFASGDVSTITTALQGIIDILTGTSAKLLATLAIAGTGYLWLSGRLSLKHAAMIGLGIGIIFGAPQIAALLGATG